jgi:hypothetical protein
MEKETVTILCSGVALGVYIPALCVNYQLKNKNVPTDLVVLENLYDCKTKLKIIENKKAFHNNFKVALAGQRLSQNVSSAFNPENVDELLDQWVSEKKKRFIIFSGFWMQVINEYRRRLDNDNLIIDIIHMDADISVSWKNFKEESKNFNNTWLFNWAEKKLTHEISVTNKSALPFDQRDNRFVIHGGGWGMGTYRSKINELSEHCFPLDIVAYDASETKELISGNRVFMMDPEWKPWEKNIKNEYEFPLFAEVKPDNTPEYKNRPEHHELFDVIKKSKAIISKPGGATLMDSLSSATPIIMLDPFGEYENSNSKLWEYLGYGVYYDDWKKTNFSMHVIEKLQNNLLNNRASLVNFTDEYFTTLGKRGNCKIR